MSPMMKKLGVLLATTWLVSACAQAQAPIVNIWPATAPGSENWDYHAQTISGPDGDRVIGVSTPTIQAFLPPADKATGTGIVIAPGGAFIGLAIDVEGRDVARWLQQHGIAAFVLSYRLMKPQQGGMPSMQAMNAAAKYAIADGVQAMKVVRQHAGEWNLSPDKIGILGFSAGGTVAVSVMLNQDTEAAPAFVGDLYGGPFGGPKTLPEELPPVFLAWAEDDPIGKHTAAKLFAALSKAGEQPEAHAYSSGGHAFGMKKQGTTSDHWINEFYWWLQAQGFLD